MKQGELFEREPDENPDRVPKHAMDCWECGIRMRRGGDVIVGRHPRRGYPFVVCSEACGKAFYARFVQSLDKLDGPV